MTDTDNERDAGDSGHEESGSRKVIYAAVFANLGIAVAKFTVAAITGSAAMLAEGIHSAVDTGNELLLLIGERNSAKPADKSHPFGYGKALYFWALLVALSVFSLGGGLSIYHGISAWRHPDPFEDPLWNYVVLAVSACFEGYSWNVSRRALNKRRKPGASLWQTVHASKDASVFTVFIEDTAALLGLAIAAVGITLGWLFDSPYFDAGASVMIGLLLVGAAFALARETGALLVGEGIGTDATRRVCQILRDDPSIEDVGKVLSMQLGPDEVLLTAAVRFNRGMRIDEVEAAIERLENAVAAAYPPIRHIYFESGALRSAMR
ncbi:cation diffusion facilitator family transporter [Massilia pinisoli]|uniref:Cation diffusion facilitator family transporter n=1 Tax=Massilia pinisoli TaxID=1772194 RepID=A0ABT1ZYW7_9BURK|nr:cation diffusion facilitator family transporter [Massilia pinisoli]MCS0585113.1 cation diffusion facilitator family transporter [Massilia pinisoli]